MYLVPLEHFAQCWATQQVFYKLFTLKTIPNLQLKCTLYVVHFLPVLDFMAALNPSIVSVELHASRATGFTFVFFCDCICPVSCVPNVAGVSGFSIIV
jgi:hypothetical protein